VIVGPPDGVLARGTIDRLRELGGRLLRNSRPYQILLERIAERAKLDAPSSVKPKAP